MKPFHFVASLVLLVATASAQQPMEVALVGTAANHQLSWTTTLNYNYQVEMSPDLQTWVDTGIAEPGTGSTITYGLMSNAPKLFYRIQETEDPYNGGFLIRPYQDEELDLIDGVCIAFNLNVFAQLPEKIRIYEREYDNPADKWEQIGAITEFADIDDIKFVRGSAVWLPEVEGEYEVQAAVIDNTGRVIASAVRRVIVGANTPPTIVIDDGPDSPSAVAQPAEFTTTVSDADGDEIRRVEFYDNGILIGTDYAAPFGDWIEDLELNIYELLRGTHDITAKVYDSRGAVGETASAFQVVITGGNARPTIEVTSPVSGLIVTQGQSFTITYNENDPDGASNLDEVEAYDIVTSDSEIDTTAPFDDLTVDTTGWEPGTHTLRVVARDNPEDESYPLYLRIFVRTGSGATFAETLVAKIVEEASAAPVVDSEIFTGIEASSGIYGSGIDSGLEINSGVVLTTGSFALWNGGDDYIGPQGDEEDHMDENDDPNFGVNRAEPGDDELEDRVTGDSTSDAAVLEFDVFCSNGQLEIDYQFGSEEYDEYVGLFNDGFMVTVDGVLVTLVPDCSDIVAVNSVNSVDPVNEHLYLDDDTDIDPLVTQANQPVQVEYDGMTIRLKAHAFVPPNTTHHVKIVIGDVDDDQLDSAIFVGEASVRTIEPKP